MDEPCLLCGEALSEALHDSIRSVSQVLYRQQESRGGQKRILTLLAERGTVPQRALAELCEVKSGSLSETLGKLEMAGLITRTQNADDKRSVNVSITDIGRLVEEDARKKRMGSLSQRFACLSEEEQRTLLSLLTKLNASWRT